MVILRFFLILMAAHSTRIFALSPVTPEKVFTREEIQRIHETKDYFFRSSLNETTPVWKSTNRRYSSHYLGNRTDYFDLNDVLGCVLRSGFPIQYQLEQLYRAKLGIHSHIGDLLPKVDLAFGQGVSGLDINKVFSGVFGFVLPANWMKLANQTRVYKSSKLILTRTVLDQILKSKLMYINQHQRIQEFEILNFYFIHLQLLSKIYPDKNRALNTMLGRFAFEGTEMASQRGRTKIGFDDLALMMALEKVGSDFTANTLNISDIEDFPEKVRDLEELEDQYRDKEKFLEQVVRKSVELKIVKEFYKISKLNIGITAAGSMFSYVDRPGNTDNDARFAFRFGYGTLPNILISRSFRNTAKIDVRKEYIGMLDHARRSFDFYTNSLGGFTEAKRSLRINRKAFKQNLKYMIDSKNDPDALFILSLNQLIDTELKYNNALHGSLRARAYMDRFLLVDNENALRFLPGKGKILEYFGGIVSKDMNEVRKEQELDAFLSGVRKSSQLNAILFSSRAIHNEGNFDKSQLVNAVQRNMDDLLRSKVTFYKSKRFFKILNKFIRENNLQLTPSQEYLLSKKIHSFWKRAFKPKIHSKDYINNFNFESFSTQS